MKVTIHVQVGDQEVEVVRSAADVHRADGVIRRLDALARVIDLAVSDARRACGLSTGTESPTAEQEVGT